MLTDPPLLTIKRSWQRADTRAIAALAGLQTGHCIDAMDGRGAMHHAIKAVDRNVATFIGTAITCEPGPNDNLAILAAMKLAQPGDVIVAAVEGFTTAAVAGDNMAMVARKLGLAALVTDGMVRDQDGIIAAGLPVFASGITPNSCVRSGPGRVGLPVVCGGVAVASGDCVIGDHDGIVVIAREALEPIVTRLEEILSAEAEAQARIAGGWTDLGGLDALLASGNVRFID